MLLEAFAMMRRLVFVFLALLLASLACNAPGRLVRRAPDFTAEDLRQTVEAMPARPAPTVVVIGGTPEPAEPVPPSPYPPAQGGSYRYDSRPGDTLPALAERFEVPADLIGAQAALPALGYLPQGVPLVIPDRVQGGSPARLVLPDSEVVFSPTAAGFDAEAYVAQGAGFLAGYHELVEDRQDLSGSEIVQRVARELSVNPRLLLTVLELRSGWVFSRPARAAAESYPLGFGIDGRSGLYQELRIAATQLNLAYYGWREGSFKTLHFEGGRTLRLDPRLNAGTVAVLHLMSLFYDWESWAEAAYGVQGLAARYESFFGNPWIRDAEQGLIPDNLAQPALELPFALGEAWSLTAGPHNAWNAGTPLGALDFSPITGEAPCAVSSRWVTASAPGIIARSADSAVALDLDGDGDEATGWVVVYFHLAERERIEAGTVVQVDQPLGHPSCEGGQATGTHVHVARKYNGEWLAADGPLPFVLGGWQAVAGERIYQGQLVRDGQVVIADPAGRSGSTIIR